MPAQKSPGLVRRSALDGGGLRRVLVVALLVGSTLGALAVAPSSASADPPTRIEEIVVHLTCVAEGAFGTAYLGLEHISANQGTPGGDITVWGPDADPENDLPILSGYNPDIARDGMTLRGDIPLRAGGADDIVGRASYDVTFAHSGPSEFEVAKGPLVVYDVRYNQRLRNEKERIPLTGSGVVTLPGIGLVSLTDCAGQEIIQDISISAPATTVGSARYPFGFADGEVCEAKGSGSTALLTLAGGEAAIRIVSEGQEEPVAFGFVFPDMRRTTMTGSVPMYGPDHEAMGEATVTATLRTVDRETRRFRIGDTFGFQRLEVLVAEGTIAFAGVIHSFSNCEGVRVLERTISR